MDESEEAYVVASRITAQTSIGARDFGDFAVLYRTNAQSFARALAWLKVGAQPTLVTRRILSYEGVLLRNHLNGGIAKGALTQEQADAKWNEWKVQRDNKIDAKKEGLVKSANEKAKAALEVEKKVNAERAEALAKKADELAEAERKAAAETAAAKAAEEVPADTAPETAAEATQEASADTVPEAAAEA